MKANAQVNSEAEAYLSKMLMKEVPYDVNILDCTFKIKNKNVYPPGKLTELFANYLLEQDLVKNKTIAARQGARLARAE